MHLPLPIRENQPPLIAGRRHVREPCTTTLVDGAPLLLNISRLPTIISMATRPLRLIRPGTPSRRVLLWGLVGPRPVHPRLVGRRPVDPRLVGRRLVDRSPCSLLLGRVHPAVTCSGETAGGGAEEGAVAVTLPPLPRPRAPPPLFLPRPCWPPLF